MSWWRRIRRVGTAVGGLAVKAGLATVAGFILLVVVLGAGLYGSAALPLTSAGPTKAALNAGASPLAPPATGAAAPFTGASTGCSEPDPTNREGCLTQATAWLYDQLEQHFGKQPTACWDRHEWNPTSDHPRGKACDVTIGRAGTFPGDADRAHGWEVANWLRANASALDIAYVIWDGKIWSASREDEDWRTYTGGGIYDVSTATGGHYDHVHVSTRD
ncbi:hypothetical protein [Quadrisphaera sp. INWT6]|uniref:hypothetical protein n=1 Tax=Quadrisphaera sp. INWT6 TaxID=2596917 RepID=UPI00189213F2|nr:hypothetical protein [Quadrisphaera sp. INWT6]MBF5082407.1 hypothetical protein [Quadrisphaera sp. INWT6]